MIKKKPFCGALRTVPKKKKLRLFLNNFIILNLFIEYVEQNKEICSCRSMFEFGHVLPRGMISCALAFE